MTLARSRVILSSIYGSAFGIILGFLCFRLSAPTIRQTMIGAAPLIYFLGPLIVSLVLGALIRRGRILIAGSAAVCCSLALFLSYPDSSMPLLGVLELWAVIGLPVFALLPLATALSLIWIFNAALKPKRESLW